MTRAYKAGAFAAIGFYFAAMGSVHALTAKQALRALGGTWAGSGAEITIDVERLEVNTDVHKPFQWEYLQLINVTGSFIIFQVGRMRFISQLSDTSNMVITEANVAGQVSLHKIRKQSGGYRMDFLLK